MGDAGILVEARFDQGVIGQTRDRCGGWNMVDRHLIAARCSSEFTIARDGAGKDGRETYGQRFPGDHTLLTPGMMCAFVDPLFQQRQFGIIQRHCSDLVALGWHFRIPFSCCCLPDQTLGTCTSFDAFAILTAFDHEIRRLHVQTRLGRRLVMAGDAVVLQERQDLLFVIDRRGRRQNDK